MDPEQPQPMKRVYVAIGDYRLDRLLEACEATGKTIEQLIQRAVAEFLDERRRGNGVPAARLQKIYSTSHLPQLIYQSGEATRKADRSAEVERKLKAYSRAFRQFVPVFVGNARPLDKN
jgi:hypothetical protein